MNFTDSPFEKMMKEKPHPPRPARAHKLPKIHPIDRIKKPSEKRRSQEREKP